MKVTEIGRKESRIPCCGKGCLQRDSAEHEGYFTTTIREKYDMRNLSEWLSIEGVHDKKISGVRIVEERDIVLTIFDSDNNISFDVAFINTCRIRINNFLEGNIIFGIEVYESDEVNEFEGELLYLLDLDLDNVHQERAFQHYRNKIVDEKLLFITIEPSYGMSGALICEKIEIR